MKTLWMNRFSGRQLKNLGFAPHNPFISHFVVCMTLKLFEHVEGFFWVTRCFLQRNILSRTPDMIVGQGIPCVRGFQLSHTPLCCLSPWGVDLQSSVHVQLFPDRSIRERCGRHCGSSRLAVDRGNKQAGR